jgi:uroporphyrinogen-III synthase
MRRVVVLRPEPGASATVERALRLGLEVISMPLFEVEPVAWNAPDPRDFDALLLTSANAVRHGGEQLAILCDLPVHAVGDATAEAARNAGLAIATTGDRDLASLLDFLEPDLRLLHPRGEHCVSADGARQSITPLTVYRSNAIAKPDIARAEGAVVLLHSPRAARRLAELFSEAGLDRSSTVIAAISRAAVEDAGDGWQAVEAAERPTDEALLALAASLCHNAPGT